ncbi:MAG: DUF92 domain-containing protein [Chloroflexi bacterium]|nr:DUF92 domain-containing protein [Chloroflexota bacterium]
MALAGVVGWLGWRTGALAPGGALAAIAIGASVWSAGWRPIFLLLTFFASSSALSRYHQGSGGGAGRRKARQVLANGGAAALLAIRFRATDSPAALTAFAGALAAANADTWASEVGQKLGGAPHDLLTGAPVPPGLSGGVTAIGTVAGALGAAVLGVAATAGGGDRRRFFSTAVGGGVGMLADSLLGATLQGQYRCASCGAPSDEPRHGCCGEAELVRGWQWLDNDLVNLACTLVGASSAAALSSLAFGSNPPVHSRSGRSCVTSGP